VRVVNNQEEFAQALELKPDALMTDRPTLLKEYLGSKNQNGQGGWTLPK
jgi:hypothetical protein